MKSRSDRTARRRVLGTLATAACLAVIWGSGVSRHVGAQAGAPAAVKFAWQLPPGFPEPRVPPDNPMSAAKVELGRHLFYDTRLSSTGTFSCATCHQQARAFADEKPQGVGVTGQVHRRGSMSLANVAYAPVLTWANPTVRRLEDQALVPMFGTDPIELGLSRTDAGVLEALKREPVYQRLFPEVFPEPEPIAVPNVTRAIAAFERTLLSGRSPYDRYRTTLAENAISPAAHRGQDLFFSDRIGCFNCHAGFNFAQPVDYVGRTTFEVTFHNTGLYNIDGRGGYPPVDTGVHGVTGDPADMGRFRAPTLRNIALTAPYMHDGSIRTLDEVLTHYASGGRAAAGAASSGGARSPLVSPLLRPFTLTSEERQDLLAFLNSLTDETFVSDPRFANPWPQSR